jgi:CHAT domain-containing protein
VALTTGMFAAWARDPARGRAEALRQEQQALLGAAATSHPFFWAPFTLAGDGGPAATR